MGGEEKEQRRRNRRTNKRNDGRKQKESKLGLIYFINQDYKFNLQTRGQRFSLTRRARRTAGLGGYSYYWLHISICLWCSCLPFSPPSNFLAGRLILIVAIEQERKCLWGCLHICSESIFSDTGRSPSPRAHFNGSTPPSSPARIVSTWFLLI